MKKSLLLLNLLAFGIISLVGCTTGDDTDNSEAEAEEPGSILEKISADAAKEMMDESEDVVILDVRTEDEYKEGHIEGAILIPDYEIETEAVENLKDKNAVILVYCRSGRRSALAATELSELGYTSIYDFGGILDWPYDIVKD